ncbi:MAG: ABC transporter permease [Acidobacteriota bacterium]|nr:ABC transporter permease [Acidobacteriota bacterium]MDH3529885.1 ABC transporter permease [Acidobacteriota bacterium]
MKLFREAFFPMVAVIAAFAIGGIIIAIIGDNPFAAFWIFLESSFGSLKGITETLFYATPLIFTGLAVAVAFRCGLLNIGAEGQLYVAAFATAWVGIKFGGTVVNVFGEQQDWSWVSLPALLLIPLCIATAIIVGGLWGAIPGFLKARFGSHEVINTIMLNFVAIGLVSYFTQYFYKIPGDPILQTAPIGEAAHIPQLNQLLPFVPETVALNISFLVAIVMCVLVYIFLWKTKWGYELRAVGENPDAAEYGGISAKKQIVIAMTISGALAGMVAIGEVLGYRHNYYHGFSGSWGFFGIAVALLGRNHPLGVFIAAVFFAMIIRGGLFIDIDTKYITKDLVEVLQAVIILFVASLQRFSK